MLSEWDPTRVFSRIPLVLAAVGARRCGKSTAISHLCYLLFEKFDLVVAFVGSAACSPCLEAMMQRHPNWDERMFFPKWNQGLVDRLLEQQTALKKKGVERQVLILMDDVVLTGRDTDQLAHIALRGRHFNISCMMAAVSYTSICKRARRCLDFLLVYSCPMSGDRKILSWEYASNSPTADFALEHLEENQCVVFETSRKQQQLFNWRAVFLEPQHFRTSQLPVLSRMRPSPSRGSSSARRRRHRRIRRFSFSGRTTAEEPEVAGSVEQTPECAPADAPRSEPAGPPTVPASTECLRTECEEKTTDGGH